MKIGLKVFCVIVFVGFIVVGLVLVDEMFDNVIKVCKVVMVFYVWNLG